MKSIITKIFTGEYDEHVHNDFIKFSRGVFENRYLLEGKKQKNLWSIKTSTEFTNFLVQRCLEGVSGTIEVRGAIISAIDIKKDIDFPIQSVKQYLGIKQVLVDTTIDAKKITNLMEKYPRVFYALSFSTPSYTLKIKAKAPKRGKPTRNTKDAPKADFCSLKTTDNNIVCDLFFDFPNFQEITARHTISIQDIILPESVDDPKTIRELSKRKGVIKRIIEVDGKKSEKEKEFIA